MSRKLEPVAQAIRGARTVLLGCHLNPDGDTVGSALALRRIIEKTGRRADVFCVDKVPDTMLDLPGAREVMKPDDVLASGRRWDLLMPVDAAAKERLGRREDGQCVFDLLAPLCAASAQIDHHGTNPGYCGVNFVDGDAAATGLIVLELAGVLGVEIDTPTAECLYVAVSTDTGNFSHGNTSAECFRAAAALMDAGLPLNLWNRRLFVSQPEAAVRLTARAVNTLQMRAGGRLAVIRLTLRDFAECAALPEHADTVVNKALAVEGAEMALLARETAEGGIKMSLRSIAPVQVDGVARAFGGGGHAQAAGCTLQGTLGECAERVARAMEAELERTGA